MMRSNRNGTRLHQGDASSSLFEVAAMVALGQRSVTFVLTRVTLSEIAHARGAARSQRGADRHMNSIYPDAIASRDRPMQLTLMRVGA
jgi:hypothetical protein